MKKNEARLDTTLERLSSGLRINGARDDAAGLAISNRLTAQIRGSQVAVRNTMDGLSLTQTAEGAIGSITDILLHVRDLAIRSNNGALSNDDVSYIQKEVSEQLTEIDRIVDVTRFSGKKIFENMGQIGYGARTGTQDIGDAVDGLRGFWLSESEKLVEKYYRLTGDGVDVKVSFYHSDDGKGAYVSGYSDSKGRIKDQTLAVNLTNVKPDPPDERIL